MRSYVLTLCLSIVTIGCQEQPLFQWEDPTFRVKGTYYFQPKAAINAFWSSLDLEQSSQDFARLRGDGFNTIILMVPWGIFQPTIKPITYSDTAFDSLDEVVRLADSFDLKVVLRLGSHEHIPQGANGQNWMAATVLTSQEEWKAYTDLFREITTRIQHPNLLFVFWTFEDTGYLPDLWLHNYSENLEAFHQWLAHRPLWRWNGLWREKNASLESVVPPNRNVEPFNITKLLTFWEFSDQLIVDRLPEACTAVKEGNPGLIVSFQPRPEIDSDYDHAPQFELPSCYSFVTTWFSPYQSYMYGDERKDLDGKETASYVARHLERTRDLSGGLPVFLDQFNFQHFGGQSEVSQHGALKENQDQLDFIEYGLPPLLKEGLGYSLWNYQDYYLNVINNGSFRFGLKAWKTSADPALIRPGPPSPHREVELRPGGFIRQEVTGVHGDQEYTLELQARGVESNAQIEILVQLLPGKQTVTKSFILGPELTSISLKVQTLSNNEIVLTLGPSPGSSTIAVRDVLLYPWIDTGGIYDVNGNPRIGLRDLFRRINALPLSN